MTADSKMAVLPTFSTGCLARRRKRLEPQAYARDQAINTLAGHALFGERNDGALDVGTGRG
mgnify:CR=1 FL=1